MPAEFHSLENLPADLDAFWRDATRHQDEISAFTAGRHWFSLMAGDDTDAKFVAVCRDDGGRCRLLIPLMDRQWPLTLSLLGKVILRRHLNVLKAGGGDLVEDGIGGKDLADTVRATLARKATPDALWFEHLADETRYEKLAACAGDAGCFAHLIFRKLPHYRFILPPTWDACKALRSSKSLGRIRSKENALSRELDSPLTLVELRGYDEWLVYRDKIESLVDASWQSQHFGQRFRVAQIQGSAEAGHLRGYLLMAQDRAVAFTLYYYGEDTLISGILAYDRKYGKHSPGTVLFLKTLQHLYAVAPPRFLDFGEGDADYKRQWSNDEIEVSAVLLVRSTLSTRFLFGALRACNGMTRCVRRLLASLGLERVLIKRLKRNQA